MTLLQPVVIIVCKVEGEGRGIFVAGDWVCFDVEEELVLERGAVGLGNGESKVVGIRAREVTQPLARVSFDRIVIVE
jgi:hypothetical protein